MWYSGEIKGYLNGETRAWDILLPWWNSQTHTHTLNPLWLWTSNRYWVFCPFPKNGESCSMFAEQNFISHITLLPSVCVLIFSPFSPTLICVCLPAVVFWLDFRPVVVVLTRLSFFVFQVEFSNKQTDLFRSSVRRNLPLNLQSIT